MCKWQRVIPRHKGSHRYRIAHGWKDEFGSFNLEALKFLIHYREPGSSIYFIFTHTHIFSFLIFFFILTFFFFFLSFFSFFLFLSHQFFLFSPLWTMKWHCTYLLPHAKTLLVLGQKSDRDKVGTGNTFPLERYLKSSFLAPSFFLELMIHSQR
jgi:hypothetical protein